MASLWTSLQSLAIQPYQVLSWLWSCDNLLKGHRNVWFVQSWMTTCCLASFGFYILYNQVCLSPAHINDMSGTSEDFVQRLTSWQNHAVLIDDNSPHKPIPWSCGSSQLQMGDKLLPEPSAHGPPWLMWSSHDWPLATLDLSCDHTRHTCISTWSCSAPQDVDEIQVNYPSMFELIHDLKGLLLR